MKPVPFKSSKSLGQHFLVDPNIADKIVRSLELCQTDYVLEIGPGQGSLTRFIIPKVAKLIAVELDKQLASLLHSKYGGTANFELINTDFLSLEIDSLMDKGRRLRIVGNIPYNISSPVIFKVLDSRYLLRDMTLMLQREVAQRLVAKPGTKDYGILSVMNQVYAHVHILFNVSRSVFSPVPKVDSAVVHWTFGTDYSDKIKDHDFFRQLVRTAFAQRRKMLRNSLKNLLVDVANCPVSLDRRPEQLSICEWVDFSNALGRGNGFQLEN
jgi:16S rRNA (adenine1518-N6/adenine1519-N6)-dimethyltransferase